MPLPGSITALKAQIHTEITTATGFHAVTALIHGGDMEAICDLLVDVYAAILASSGSLDTVLAVGNVSNDKDMIFKNGTGGVSVDISADFGQINMDNFSGKSLISGDGVLFYLDAGSVLQAGIFAGGGAATLLLKDATSIYNSMTIAGVLTASRTYKDPDASGIRVLQDNVATLTNKRYVARYSGIPGGAVATPTANVDNLDILELTAQSASITSMTITGTPTPCQSFSLVITASATITIALGVSFEASAIPLPTSLTSGSTTDIAFRWNAATSKWRIVGQC